MSKLKTMEIKVLDKDVGTLIRMKVRSYHTVGNVVKTITRKLKLPEDRVYALGLVGKEFGPEMYETTLETIGVKDGDQLSFMTRARKEKKRLRLRGVAPSLRKPTEILKYKEYLKKLRDRYKKKEIGRKVYLKLKSEFEEKIKRLK